MDTANTVPAWYRFHPIVGATPFSGAPRARSTRLDEKLSRRPRQEALSRGDAAAGQLSSGAGSVSLWAQYGTASLKAGALSARGEDPSGEGAEDGRMRGSPRLPVGMRASVAGEPPLHPPPKNLPGGSLPAGGEVEGLDRDWSNLQLEYGAPLLGTSNSSWMNGIVRAMLQTCRLL